MNEPTARRTDLDHRLARLFGTLDTSPEFAARLGGRIARERPEPDAAARARAREQARGEHLATEAALKRSLRRNLLLVAGAASAALGPAWLCGRILGRALGALPGDGGLWLAGTSGALLIGWLWVLLARSQRGESATALFA
jgi:hypothetical protein